MDPICTKPWTRLYITADGKCWNCCYQKFPFHTITPNGDTAFESIWNNVNIQHMRTMLKAGGMPHFCDCLNKKGEIPPPDQDATIPFAAPVKIPLVQVKIQDRKKV